MSCLLFICFSTFVRSRRRSPSYSRRRSRYESKPPLDEPLLLLMRKTADDHPPLELFILLSDSDIVTKVKMKLFLLSFFFSVF